MGSAEPLQPLSENIPHYIGSVPVNLQALVFVASFDIAVDGKGSYKSPLRRFTSKALRVLTEMSRLYASFICFLSIR